MFEQNPQSRVLLDMHRRRAIIASLLPVWLLVTLLLCPLDPRGWVAPGFCCAALDTAEDTVPAPSKPCCSHDESARCQWRRNGGDRVEVAPNFLGPLATCVSISFGISAPVTPLAGDAFLLPQRWQFVWRTAAEPRAPAILS
jgi:hypothetical protein